MRLKFLSLLAILTLPAVLAAKTIHLLDIPLYGDRNNAQMFSYTIETQKACSFSDVAKISMTTLDESQFTFIEKLARLQRSVNLSIVHSSITKDLIEFSLQGSTNINFEFAYDKKTCELTKIVIIDNKKYTFSSIDVDYSTALKTPVLKRLIIRMINQDDIIIYPWALHESLATYEFEVGAGLEIHSNIRLNDKATFHKSDPTFGPVGIFSFRYGPLFINRLGAGSFLFNYKKFNILAIALLEGENYMGTNLQKRKEGLFIGALATLGFVEFTFYNDFIDQEKGFNLKLNIAPKFYYQTSWRFKPQIFAQYWSNMYVDYYFGVTPSEMLASGLLAYDGSHTINYGSTLEISHYVGQWTFITELAAKFFGNEVYNSPTVTKKREFKMTSGILYKFF